MAFVMEVAMNKAGGSPAMSQITAGLKTKSDQIRALHKAGYRRSDIANFLKLRYQHVRNVIVAMEQKAAHAEANHPTAQAHLSMGKLTAGLKTKADKIRVLEQAGYSRSDIARFLDIRYQHVRNVLVHAGEQAQTYETAGAEPDRAWINVAPDGRAVIPAAFRPILGIEGGGAVLMVRNGDSLKLVSRIAAIREAQAAVAPYLSQRSMVDDLLSERRAEARSENRSE